MDIERKRDYLEMGPTEEEKFETLRTESLTELEERSKIFKERLEELMAARYERDRIREDENSNDKDLRAAEDRLKKARTATHDAASALQGLAYGVDPHGL